MGNKRAGIIIRKYGTNMILLEQGWGKSLPGTIYDIPKGHWEPGELLETTAIREAKEEAGIEVEQNELTFLGEFPYAKGDTLALFYCEKKFDIVLMNPPYEGELHIKFLIKVLEISNKVINISPIDWMLRTPNYFKNKGQFYKYYDIKLIY